ncbi:MAG: HAD family hydrolase [Atopobiaceae bacterium]|nr:HAD family hydrolase [Atopobiaceae bacterium]
MSEPEKKKFPLVPLIAFVACCILVAAAGLAATSAGLVPVTMGTESATKSSSTEFPSWAEDSPALASLVEYVKAVCDESSDYYVPAEDRIATFDMDGTILCERAPVYADYMMLIHRVLDDPTYTPSTRAIYVARQLRANADKGIVADDLDAAKNALFAQAFSDMTADEFRAYASEFFENTEVEGFSGMTYAQSFYQPMVELIKYLRDHDFDVYLVSACEREVIRTIAGSRLGIPYDHVIGSDFGMYATEQGAELGNNYTMGQEEDLYFSTEQMPSCAKTNKSVYIQREIGKRPILAFGNSSGDFSMLNYAAGNKDYKGMGVFIICDDTQREYGNLEKASGFQQEVDTQGWVGVSMANDWATIYGEGVEKTALVADGGAASSTTATTDEEETEVTADDSSTSSSSSSSTSSSSSSSSSTDTEDEDLAAAA